MTLCQNKNLVLHLPFIVHQADLMAARIEFEREWLPKLKVTWMPQKEFYIGV
jgi:hypothetical protein